MQLRKGCVRGTRRMGAVLGQQSTVPGESRGAQASAGGARAPQRPTRAASGAVAVREVPPKQRAVLAGRQRVPRAGRIQSRQGRMVMRRGQAASPTGHRGVGGVGEERPRGPASWFVPHNARSLHAAGLPLAGIEARSDLALRYPCVAGKGRPWRATATGPLTARAVHHTHGSKDQCATNPTQARPIASADPVLMPRRAPARSGAHAMSLTVFDCPLAASPALSTAQTRT